MSQPANEQDMAKEIDRLQKLLVSATQLDQDIKILEQEARRLHIDAQEFIDKKNILQVLHHISEH